MKVSLKSQIYQKVRQFGYISIDEILNLATEGNYQPWTAKRKSQELAKVGSIVPVYNSKGHLTGYSIGKTEVITHQKPKSAPISVFQPQSGTMSHKEVKTQENALYGQLSLL